MKQSMGSVPAVLSLSAAALFSIALAGCGGSGSNAPAAAKNVYAIEFGTDTTSVVVFSASATGTTTPASTLILPSNFLAEALAIGPQGQIYVSGRQISNGNYELYGTILEYPAGSSGSATPSVTLNGSTAGTATFTYAYGIAVNSAGTLFLSSADGSIEAFASGFTATSAPTQYLTWGKTNFLSTGNSIGVDNAGDVFYIDLGNGGGTKSVIDVFAAGTTGATAPVRTIKGTNTTSFYYNGFAQIAVDGAGDLFVAYYNEADDPNAPAGSSGSTLANNEATGIIEFAAGATGNATPVKRIGGALTQIVEPDGFALDAEGNLYYVDAVGTYFANGNTPQLLQIFSSSATGNVAPTRSITTTGYTYNDSDEAIVAY
jgi:hypothetical protein